MGFFGRLMFWRKNDALADDLAMQNSAFPPVYPGSDPMQSWSQPGSQPAPNFAQGTSQNAGLGGLGQSQGQNPWGSPSYGQQPYSPPSYSPPQMESFQRSDAYAAGRQMEVVSAKLDALKAAVDALSQRVANVERMMEHEENFRRRGW